MINIYRGAGILFYTINKKNKLEFFLCKRYNSPICWSIPGGGFDEAEGDTDNLSCAIRETREEIGIIVPDDIESFTEINFNIPLIYNWSTFLVRVDKKKLNKFFKIKMEFKEGRWFRNMPHKTHKLLHKIIKDLTNKKYNLRKTKIKKELTLGDFFQNYGDQRFPHFEGYPIETNKNILRDIENNSPKVLGK